MKSADRWRWRDLLTLYRYFREDNRWRPACAAVLAFRVVWRS